jgi:hypothetical protein
VKNQNPGILKVIATAGLGFALDPQNILPASFRDFTSLKKKTSGDAKHRQRLRNVSLAAGITWSWQ